MSYLMYAMRQKGITLYEVILEENKKLKEENEKLKAENSYLENWNIDKLNENYVPLEDYEKLKEENEKLKDFTNWENHPALKHKVVLDDDYYLGYLNVDGELIDPADVAELEEEIKKLKKENRITRMACMGADEVVKKLEEEIKKLKEENKQLKEDLWKLAFNEESDEEEESDDE